MMMKALLVVSIVAAVVHADVLAPIPFNSVPLGPNVAAAIAGPAAANELSEWTEYKVRYWSKIGSDFRFH